MVFTRSKKRTLQSNDQFEVHYKYVKYNDTDNNFVVKDNLDNDMDDTNNTDNTNDMDDDMDDTDDDFVERENFDKESESEGPDYDPEIDEFDDMIQSIYDGDFFEANSFNINIDDLKNLSKSELHSLNSQLNCIKQKYSKNVPSIVEIIRMDISLQQKQELLESVFHLTNCELLSPEYYIHLKSLQEILTTKYDPELDLLEKKILQSSLNKDMGESYKHKILKSDMSFQNKVIAYNKLEVMQSYKDNDTSEYAKHKTWLDLLLYVPFGIYNDSNVTINSSPTDINTHVKFVRDTLDHKLSFLEKPKDQIINIMTGMMRNNEANINAIGLYGKKGVGKTSIAQCIAESLRRPFKMISLGGESDANSLTGHGFTYVGSGPGSIINSLINTKSMGSVLLIDEIDKISETQQGKEIIGTLIHLIDSTTNNKYNHDKYFSGIEFDLSKVLFIFTYNDPTKIDKILADRLFKIKIDDYTFKEKLEITNKHIIPAIFKKLKFNTCDISFEEDAITHLVQFNKSDGMRDIKTKIEIILSRINTLLLTNESDKIINLKYKKLYPFYKKLPVCIPNSHIDTLLDESVCNEIDDKIPFGMYT